MGFPSKASSVSYVESLRQLIFSNFSILLLDKNILYNLAQYDNPETVSIKFLLRLSSVKETRPFNDSTEVIRLFARLRTLSSVKWLMFSILVILLECKSSTSSLFKFYRFLMRSM
jgi:hypothetical protein